MANRGKKDATTDIVRETGGQPQPRKDERISRAQYNYSIITEKHLLTIYRREQTAIPPRYPAEISIFLSTSRSTRRHSLVVNVSETTLTTTAAWKVIGTGKTFTTIGWDARDAR